MGLALELRFADAVPVALRAASRFPEQASVTAQLTGHSDACDHEHAYVVTEACSWPQASHLTFMDQSPP